VSLLLLWRHAHLHVLWMHAHLLTPRMLLLMRHLLLILVRVLHR